MLGAAVLCASCRDRQRTTPANSRIPSGGVDRRAGRSRRPQTAEEALEELWQGNARFVAGRPRHPDENEAWRNRLVQEQHPFVTLLGCSDSRIPPELLFDQGFGDIFVVRVAGNVLDPCIEGRIEYGVQHLHTPLLLVLGHEDCGAVKAALASAAEKSHEPPEIQSLVRAIEPGLRGLDRTGSPDALIHAGVEANVRRVVDELSQLPTLTQPIREGKLAILGAVYVLETGEVRRLPGAPIGVGHQDDALGSSDRP